MCYTLLFAIRQSTLSLPPAGCWEYVQIPDHFQPLGLRDSDQQAGESLLKSAADFSWIFGELSLRSSYLLSSSSS